MENQETKSLGKLYEEICEVNRFFKYGLEITYTPKQPSVENSTIEVTENKDTFSGCILRKIVALKEMQKWNISYYLKTRNDTITLRIFM